MNEYSLAKVQFISFITEVEGEKISVRNHYHQDTNQQDMFNMAMSSNLEKVHEVLGRKYEDDSKKEDTCDRLTEKQEDISLSKATKENVDEDIEDNDNDEEDEEETVEQRQALYFFVHKLTTPSYYQGDSLTSSLTLLTYKNTLELSDYEIDEILSTPFYKEDELIKDLKSIKNRMTINLFLYECVTLIDKTESGAAIPFFFNMIQELGLSIEDVRNGIHLIETVHSEHFYDRIRKLSWEDLNDNEQADETKESSNKAKETQENGIPIEFLVEDLKENYDYKASLKKHALTFGILRPNSEFWYYSRPDDEKPLWIYNDKKDDKDRGVYMMDESYAIGLYPLLWYYKKYDDKESLCWLFDFLDRRNIDLWAQDYFEEAVDDNHPEELIKKMKRYVPSLKIGNDPQKIKENLSWSWIDIQSLLLFINYCMNSLDWSAKPNESINSLQDCSTLSDLAYLILKDLGIGHNSISMNKDAEIDLDKNNDNTAQDADSEPEIIESWPLLEFAKKHGTMKVTAPITHVNRRTGEEYEARSCAFVHPTKKDEQGRAFVLFVDFSSRLGELTPKEIADQQKELIVVKYNSGVYLLDRKLDNTTSEVELSTEVTDEDLTNAWTDEYGVQYSKDRKRLLKAPEELEDYSIIEGTIVICDNSFCDCNSLEKINIPNTIKQIGKYAFCRCLNLKSIKLPESIDAMDSEVFWYCRKLSCVTLLSKIDYIPSGTFVGCNLEVFTIPESTKLLGSSCFASCDFKQIEIPQNVYKIERMAFFNCKKLETITITSKKLDSIGQDVFKQCSSLRTIIVPIGEKEKIDALWPEYKDIIKEQSSENEKTSGIEKNWWADENGIPYIIDYMPSSSNSDNEETDDNLMNEDEVTHTEEKTDDDLENVWTDEYGVQYSEDKKRLLYVPEDVEEYSIAEGTEEIGDYAFVNIECEDVSYDYIMENNLDIEDFERHPSKLVSVTIPNSVTKIGKGIFDWCTNLAVISIPEGTTERFKRWLPDYEDIFVEGDISTIAHLEDLEEIWTDEYGVKYSIDKRKLLKAPSDIAKCVILAGTKIICDGAFFECKNLNNIHLPESIRIIGKYAFYGCDSLTEINLPKAILMIGEHSFDECRMLESLYIPKNGYSQFAGMLPSLYKKIKVSPLNSVIDEDGVVYDNDYQILHFNTLPLDTYTVKFGVKAIDNYAFKPAEWKKDDGKSLKRLVLPDSIVIIGVGAFCYNESLEYINIPPKAAFQSEENPFVGCFNLHTIKWETHNAVKEGTLVFNRNKTELVACLPWHYIDGVQKCWPLQSFAKQFGKMQVRAFVDQQTGEEFKSCVFTKLDGTHTFVEFSSSVDSIPPHKISEMMDELQVVMMETGNYSLFKGKTIIEQESIVELPDGLETIAANAFYHNEVLKEIKMPDTITDIGKNAFEGCISLSSIYIPLGTLDKFEKLLPELKHLLDEVDDLPF